MADEALHRFLECLLRTGARRESLHRKRCCQRRHAIAWVHDVHHAPWCPTRFISLVAGGFERNPGADSNDANLTLTISGSPTYLTRFTDRPLRQAFVVANENFVNRWSSYFASSPPNAVLAFTPPGASRPRNIVVTLTKPRWNASAGTWTFHAARILKQSDNLPNSTPVSVPTIPTPKKFTNVSLMIDPSSTTSTVLTPNSSVVATSSGQAIVLSFLIDGTTYWSGVVSSTAPTVTTPNVGSSTVTLNAGGMFSLTQSSSATVVTFRGTIDDSGSPYQFSDIVVFSSPN